MKRVLLVSCLIASLSGCASMPWFGHKKVDTLPPVQEVPQPEVDPLIAKLALSAQRIDAAVQNLNAVNTAARLPELSAKQKEQMEANNAFVPAGLDGLVTVKYDGPLETFVRQLASQIGGGWQWGGVQGVKPGLDILINKDYNDTPIVAVLQDIGYSVTGATIVVDNRSKTIRIRYL